MTNNYLPPEWQDEERIRVLMGPMPASKEIVSYNSRITFWSAALFNWCNVKNTLTFTLYASIFQFYRISIFYLYILQRSSGSGCMDSLLLSFYSLALSPFFCHINP